MFEEWEDDTIVPTRAEIKNRDGIYSVEVNALVETSDELRDYVLEPLLLAMGYHPSTIDKLFNVGDDYGVIIPTVWNKDLLVSDGITTTYTTPAMIGVGTRFVSLKTNEYTDAGVIFALKLINDEIVLQELDKHVDSDFHYWDSFSVSDINDMTMEELDMIFDGDYHTFARLAD